MTKIIQRENCHTKYLLLRRWILSQQTFVGHEDVLKMSSKHVLNTSSTRLQRNNFSSFKTKNFFIFRSSFSSTSNVCFQIGRCVATTWQWSFHLISKTTQDWKDVWIPSPNLASLRQTNWFYWFVKREKKTTSSENWLLGSLLQKSFPKSFTKFTEKYLS